MRYTHVEPPAPEDMVGPYRVVSPLASGGHGDLFLAEHEGRRYVLKFMSDDGGEAWCRREVGLLLLVQSEGHEGIVRIDGHGRWPDVEHGLYEPGGKRGRVLVGAVLPPGAPKAPYTLKLWDGSGRTVSLGNITFP